MSPIARRRAAAVAVLAAAAAAPVLLAAETKWNGSFSLAAIYDENVYLSSDDLGEEPRSSSGGAATAEAGLSRKTQRGDLTGGYKAIYRYYSEEQNANNLQHFLSLHYSNELSERSTFTIGEDLSYSEESDNFYDRGVETAFTAGPRAPQTRSLTAVGITTQLSQRWTLNADYSFRVLVNGTPENDPVLTTGACCAGPVGAETCAVVTEATCVDEGGAFLGRGTACSASACTLGAAPAPISAVTVVFDEHAHAVNVGGSYQVSTASTLGARASYSYTSYEADLFGTQVLETSSVGGSLTYGWSVGEKMGFTAALGGYRAKDTPRSASITPSGVPGAVPSTAVERSYDDITADLTFSRADQRGTFTAGLTRGLSSFDGLGRITTVDDDGDGSPDDTNGDGTSDLQVEPLGSSTRTTVYGSYNYRLGQSSNLTIAANATQREEFDGSTLTAYGAGGNYGLRFAPWGGVQAGYLYTRQTSSGEVDLQGREFTNNTALLGLFVSTPW